MQQGSGAEKYMIIVLVLVVVFVCILLISYGLVYHNASIAQKAEEDKRTAALVAKSEVKQTDTASPSPASASTTDSTPALVEKDKSELKIASLPVEKPVVSAPAPKLIEGNSYKCTNGPDGIYAVYRAVGNELRWYPGPGIAASWNPDWASNITTIDCSSGVKFGTQLGMKS